MDHEWFKTRLSELQDAELPEEERRRILQHAGACPSCREQLEHWKGIRQALSGLLRVDSSDAFIGQVMTKVGTLPTPQPAVWRLGLDRLTSWIPEWLYPELGIAAAALLLFAIGFFQQGLAAVSAESLLMSRQPRDIEWVRSPQPTGGAALEILWEGI